MLYAMRAFQLSSTHVSGRKYTLRVQYLLRLHASAECLYTQLHVYNDKHLHMCACARGVLNICLIRTYC